MCSSQRERLDRISHEQLDLLPTPIFIKGLDGVYLWCNAAFERFMGVERGEVVGKTAYDLAPQHLAAVYEESDRKLLSEGEVQVYEHPVQVGENETSHVRFYKSLWRGEDGTPKGIIGQFFDVTQRHEAQEALSRANDILEDILEHIPALIHVSNVETHEVLFMNKQSRDAFGPDCGDRKCWQIFHDRTEPCPVCVEAFLKDSDHCRDNYRNWQARNPVTGRWYDNHNRKTAWFGKERACMQFSVDISEAKHRADLFAARIRLVEKAAESSLEELLVAVIDEAEALTESAIGFFHFLEEDQETLFLQAWSTNTTANMCRADGKGTHYKVSQAGVWVDCIRERRTIVHNDYESLPGKRGLPEGHAPVIREMVTPIFREGTIVAILGVGNKETDYDEQDIDTLTLIGEIAWDISQRKIAEGSLAEAHKRLSFHIENSQLGVIEWAGGAAVSTWSQQAERIFGWKVHEVMGKNWEDFEFVHPDDRARVEQELMPLFSGSSSFNAVENRNLTKDGRVIHCHWFNSALTNAEGEVVSILSQVADVSELKRYEKQLKREKERAEAASRAKSEFLANMSHEIRTPLNGILGMLTLLERSGLNEEQQEYIMYSMQSSKRLARLLADILDASRFELTSPEMDNAVFDLHDVVRDACELFQVTARQSEVELHCSIAPGTPREVRGDGMRLMQVLNNLLGNAFKFTEQGTVTLEISALPISPPGRERIHFVVSDTGIGIPEDKLEMLFQPFTQVSEGYRRDYQGAGLGLAISKQLVERMGGNIVINTEEGLGCAIHFTALFDVVAGQEAGRDVQETVPLLAQGRLKILVVEDDDVNRMAIEKTLENQGHKVLTAENGSEAIHCLMKHHVDVVFMDIQMPVMDGVTAAERIRKGAAGESRANTPIIALTAYAMEDDKTRFMMAGMNEYISKPATIEDMQRAIREVVTRQEGPGLVF